MEYFYKKPTSNLNNGSQLFAEDTKKSGAKKWFYSDHKTVFEIIRSNPKTLHLYEDQTYCEFIKLHFDIDYVKTYQTRLDKKIEARGLIGSLMPRVISKIKSHFPDLVFNPQYIVYMSEGLNKLSLHVIFSNVYFRSIIEMKFFCAGFELIDQLVYKKGCFRLPLCSKFGKYNKLKYLMSSNEFKKKSDPVETFLSSCISYYNPDPSNIIFDKLEWGVGLANFRSKPFGTNDYYYFYLGIEEVECALDKIDLTKYSTWLAVCSSIKDLYTHIKATDEQKEHIYNLFDTACSKYPKYKPDENRKIFDKLDHYFDINYLFHLAESNYKIVPLYNLEKITFNKTSHPAPNIQIQHNQYIEIDLDKLTNIQTLFIKSPTGSGKTRTLQSIICKLECESVLSITSRTNLAGEHIGDLNLKFYKHLKWNEFMECNRLAIQLESVYKVNTDLFEDGIVILDEVNSLLSHFRSPTVDDKRAVNFRYFVELISTAKYLICLDADLCDWNIEFINKIRSGANYLILYNQIMNKAGIPATFYTDQNIIINRMVEQIQEGKYFVACFDSLTYMKKIINYLGCYENNKNFLIYSSETNCELIDTTTWTDKWVFYSPSIIYGLSYDTSASEVYSFTVKSHLTSSHIYQMINRTRLLTHVHVYCNPETNIPKYKTIESVENDYNLLKTNALQHIDQTNISEYDQLYKFIYTNTTYIDNILKSNPSHYLLNIMGNLGFDIKFNYTQAFQRIKLDGVKYSKKEIKDNILNIFGLDREGLNKFQTKLFESNAGLEKHFNLRAYYKNTVDDKININVQKAMFSECMKSRYLKIKLATKFMQEMGFEYIQDIKFEGKGEKKLCLDCTTNILKPKENANKYKTVWCNPIVKKLKKLNDSDSKKISLGIYSNIIDGKTLICKTCQKLLNKNMLVTNDILYSKPNLAKYSEDIKSDWIVDNLNIIIEMFSLNKNDFKTKQYYPIYQIMIGILKDLFGYDLFESERLHDSQDNYYFYSINDTILQEHKNLFNMLDNKYIKTVNYDSDSEYDSDVIDE